MTHTSKEITMELDHVDNTKGELPKELLDHFQGEAKMQPFVSPFPEGPAVFAVHFQAGGRTKPHTHRFGQVLHITSGQGIVGTMTGRHVVEPGDIVTVMPNEWHWHGGTPTSPMTHVTVQMTGPDSIDWDVDERDWASDYGD
jgi:quercetin dioxygenase-like cupin family protein